MILRGPTLGPSLDWMAGKARGAANPCVHLFVQIGILADRARYHGRGIVRSDDRETGRADGRGGVIFLPRCIISLDSAGVNDMTQREYMPVRNCPRCGEYHAIEEGVRCTNPKCRFEDDQEPKEFPPDI